MPILSARGVSRSYGLRSVLDDVSFTLESDDRIGLVGRNGAGKSTLCRILAGIEEADAGEVVRKRGLEVGYLEQEPAMPAEDSAREVVLAGLARWRAALDRHTKLSRELEVAGDGLDALLTAQAAAAAEVERQGGWEMGHVAESVLAQVGVADVEQPVGTMSGGERRRVGLARLLVSAPDLAIIDEPTNHLDIETIEWLESWLRERYVGALLLVTHDRYLLDRVATRTFEVDAGKVHAYQGGWGEYLEAKAERSAHAERAESNRRNYLRRELEWLRRQPKARTGKSKARVDRILATAAVESVAREKHAEMEVSKLRSGRSILEADDLVVEIAGRTLVDGLTLRLAKGHRVGIVGPNGCGKSSLLSVLRGERPPAGGTIRRAKHSSIAYLDQARGDLDDDQTVYDQVAEGRSRIEIGGLEISVRAYLERFLFDSHQQVKRVGTLSGGERARVGLARTFRDAAHLIVLDEPTNDLDVSTLAALEEALLEFDGAALIVTHDRWFLDRVATSLLVFEQGGNVELHTGNYSDYAARRGPPRRRVETEAHREAPSTEPAGSAGQEPSASPGGPRPLTYGERIELEGLMDRIETAESAVSSIEAEISSPAFYERPRDEQRRRLEELDRARAEAEVLVSRWEQLEALRDASG